MRMRKILEETSIKSCNSESRIILGTAGVPCELKVGETQDLNVVIETTKPINVQTQRPYRVWMIQTDNDEVDYSLYAVDVQLKGALKMVITLPKLYRQLDITTDAYSLETQNNRTRIVRWVGDRRVDKEYSGAIHLIATQNNNQFEIQVGQQVVTQKDFE